MEVRRFFIFILIVQFLSGNVVGNELAKMPFMVRHFRLHVAVNPEDTWFDFLGMHYANAQHRQADPAHRQLPLFAVQVSVHAQTLLPDPVEWPIYPAIKAQPADGRWPDESLLPGDFRGRLLRPPRM